MKTPKLLKKAEQLLDADKAKQRNKADALKQILGQLKKRKRKLRDELQDSSGKGESERIRKDLKIIHAQRKKGLKILKGIK